MLIAELEGPLLDYWVGRVLGLEELDVDAIEATYVREQSEGPGPRVRFSPSSDWTQGGSVVERLNISVIYEPDSAADEPAGTWTAYIQPVKDGMFWGARPLIAAMRAAVHHRFGHEVQLLR